MADVRRLQDFDNEYLFVLPKDVLQDYIFSPIIANLYVTDLGFFPNAQYHYVNREQGSAGWIIIFCTGGAGTVKVGDATYHLHQYSLIIMPPGIKHTYYASQDDPWDIYWLHFRGQLADEYVNVSPNKAHFIEQLSSEQVNATMRQFWQMIKSFLPGFTYNSVFYVSQVLGVMLATLALGDTDQQTSTHGGSYVDAAIHYIYQHIDEPIKLADVADHLGISTSYLSRKFKEVVNSSVIAFITTIKMKRASHYLQYTNVPIQQVAQRLGYTDSYYFSRVFKKEFGLSPRHFRNKL
ncbi:AraC family transcriptional regulator [Levilactobacillus hammesii]|uniref:AraC family transcriptional regulator n=1 Tax=Levilactobacillus hammesii DSM 16381 TaxID=1423753 RepID=A0A0R1V5A0_9LACO|nr:AraC family transcriptional regulator [Levilactobacillus hammesii]KRL98258.1 AraC family transcriptional regulator [Levilactobacillus hammesii DSM 16381]